MADSASGMSKVLTTTTTFIEKAIEFRHFMLIVSFLLALDSSLIIFYQKNLLESFLSLNAPEVDAAGALIFLGLFAFLMSLLFPAMRQLLLGLTRYLWVQMSVHLPRPRPDYDYEYTGYVRRRAITERDKLLMDLVYKQEEVTHDHNVNMNIGFAVVMLFVLNFWMLGTAQFMTLTQVAATLPDVVKGFWLTGLVYISYGVFLTFLSAIFWMSLNPERQNKMYLPESEAEKATRIEKQTARRKMYLG
ncbi:hypothetical protein V2L00_23345 [Pseudomonas alliivorans]|nr:hypothetical protein [Pseudomonas alliivorans]